MPFSTVILASDHGGFQLKSAIRQHLEARAGLTVLDLGPEGPSSCDYPPYAQAVGRKVLATPGACGILVCGTGIGMSMAANRLPGIRAALCHTEFEARMTRAHNDANVLCLGERVIGVGLALGLVDLFLSADFEAGRHARRIELLEVPGVPGLGADI